VTFSCDGVPLKPLPDTGSSIGIDLGPKVFAATSDGELIENHRHLKSAEADLKRCQRKISKAKPGGSRRGRLVRTLARKHRKVERQRLEYHFQLARYLIDRYDTIAVEDLNVLGLASGLFAKSVHDAGWAQFVSILGAKAEEAVRLLIKVDPRGTTQICSGCQCDGEKKTLADRTHTCLRCGLVLDRDVNAARNILHRALAQLEKEVRTGPSASRPASSVAVRT
jgi:putative transposase